MWTFSGGQGRGLRGPQGPECRGAGGKRTKHLEALLKASRCVIGTCVVDFFSSSNHSSIHREPV